MTDEMMVELQAVAAWLTALALAWYAARLTIGFALVLLGSRRGSGRVQRCGLRLLPRRLRPAVARWAAAPALGLGLAVLGGPAMATALECPAVGLPPLDRADSCPAPWTGRDGVAAPGLATDAATDPSGPAARVADPPDREAPEPERPDHVEPAAERPREQSRALTVRPGDSLWSLTANSLGTTSPDTIARSWVELYRANQELIGPDPGLIHPGMTLQEPPHWGGATR